MHCQSCGGVLGRDCFNPQECAEITADMARRAYEPVTVAAGFGDLLQELRDEMSNLFAGGVPSNDLPELLSAAVREIEGLRRLYEKTNT